MSNSSGILKYWGGTQWNPVPDLSGYVPYTGATTDVDLGAHNLITTGTGTFGIVNSTDENNALQIDGNTILRTGASANYNIFLGEGAFANDEGQYNVGIGYRTGYYNDTTGGGSNGDYNVYIGNSAGYGNIGGSTARYNVAIGSSALRYITSGRYCVAIAAEALKNERAGVYNIAIGANSQKDSNGGDYNTSIGATSLRYNVTGQYNLACGDGAGFGVNGNSFSYNTLLGTRSGYSLTTGSNNIFIG